MESQQRRIAVFYPFSNFDSVPSLHNLVDLLTKHGYAVDIFACYDYSHKTPSFNSEAVRFFTICHHGAYQNPLLIWLSKQVRYLRSLRAAGGGGVKREQIYVSEGSAFVNQVRDIVKFLLWLPRRMYYQLWMLRQHTSAPYVAFIGVDPTGLISADNVVRRLLKIPLVYYSLELLLSYEITKNDERRLKKRERDLNQRAAFTIIQDPERSALLIKDNRLDPRRVIHVVNAPLGAATTTRSDYLRKRFNLPPERKIVLYTGSLAPFSGIDVLLQSTHTWPDTWVLICHFRGKIGAEQIQAMQKLGKPGSVLFSSDPLSYHEYPELIRSADVGVALYQVRGDSTYGQDNIRYIGLSSGKIAYYLQAGLPIVVNDNSSFRRITQDYRCGEIAETAEQITASIAKILQDYQTYQHGAIRCFREVMDVEAQFEQVILHLERI